MKRALLILTLFAASCGRTALVPASVSVSPPELPQRLAGCGDKSLLAVDGRQLLRIDAGGTRTLFSFATDLPDDEVLINDWQAEGDFIGAYAFLDTKPIS